MPFPLKKRLRSLQASRSAFLQGKITVVNSDGTYDVVCKARSEDFSHVGNMAGVTFQVGDYVSLSQYEGDRQKPVITGYGGYYSDETFTVVDV